MAKPPAMSAAIAPVIMRSTGASQKSCGFCVLDSASGSAGCVPKKPPSSINKSAALNLSPVRALLSWKPLVWLGGLSAAIYYVHNNVMQDYLLLNALTGAKIDLLAPVSFLLILLSTIPWALLFRAAGTRVAAKKKTHHQDNLD